MTSFLEVLVKGEELHQLPRRGDLLESRRLVDNSRPFPGDISIGSKRPSFRHCVVVVGVLLIVRLVNRWTAVGDNRKAQKEAYENTGRKSSLKWQNRSFREEKFGGEYCFAVLDRRWHDFAQLQGEPENLTGARRGATTSFLRQVQIWTHSFPIRHFIIGQ